MTAARRSRRRRPSGCGPILMTTAAMVVGMVPLLIAAGAGAASRFAIGLVIAAGMTIGTLFTLFVTPAVYTFVARDHQKVRAQAEAAEAAKAQSPEPETLAEAEAAAEAGMLFPAGAEPDLVRRPTFAGRACLELNRRNSLWPRP